MLDPKKMRVGDEIWQVETDVLLEQLLEEVMSDSVYHDAMLLELAQRRRVRPDDRQLALIPPDPPPPSPRASEPIGVTPQPAADPDVRPGFKLFRFQEEGARWLADKGRALLADEMGVGKTATAIAWGKDRRPCLVIVPASLVLNWAEKELKTNWRRRDSVLVLDGQNELPSTLPDWVVLSYGQVGHYLGQLRRAGFQTLILDEAHYIRNLEAQRTQDVLDIVDPLDPLPTDRPPRFRLIVTGTPIVNGVMDLFPFLVILGLRDRRDWQAFKRSASRPGFEQSFYNQLRPYMLRRTKAEVYPDMPPKTHTVLPVGITNADDYYEAEGAFFDWLKKQSGSGLVPQAALRAEAIVRMTALRDLAAKGKARPVADWLKPCLAAGGKVIIFCTRKEPLELVRQQHPASLLYTGELSKEDRQRFVDSFQKDPGVCYFLGTYGAAAVGITLTAADRVVLLDLPWTPADKQQAEDRAHRFGQKKPVEVVTVIAPDTIDERVLEILAQKEVIINQAVEGKDREAARRASIANELFERMLRRAQRELVPMRRPPQYVSDDELEATRRRLGLPAGELVSAIVAQEELDNGPEIARTYAQARYRVPLRQDRPTPQGASAPLSDAQGAAFQWQVPLAQVPDRWGSRCRDPLGRWTFSTLCPISGDGGAVIVQPAVSNKTFALGANGVTRYEFEFQVLDASELVVSHDPFTFSPNPAYPQELQPRMRDRAATRLQVQRIAQNLDPDALLTDFRVLDRGAPIIGPDRVVESGNGRVMAIMLAARESPERYAAYRQALEARIGEFGLSASDLAGKQTPILVRLRLTQVDRRAFTQEGNTPATISTSAIEQARTDAEKITLVMLQTLQVGEGQSIEDALRSSANRPFVQAFLQKLPETEVARLVDAQGVLNQDGVRRVMMAIFVSAFPGDAGLRLAEMAFESIDLEVRNVVNGISRALGQLAQAEALARQGARDAELSISDDLAAAATILAKIKRTPGLTVPDYLAQQQLFQRELTPFQEKLLVAIAGRIRSARRIGRLLANYAQLVIQAPPPAQVAFFPGAGPTKEALWDKAARQEEEEYALERAARREPVAAAAQRDPRRLVDWCNIGTDQQEAIWSWRPLREVILTAMSFGSTIQVCQTGLIVDPSRPFVQLTIGTGHLQPDVETHLAGEVQRRLGRAARRVYTAPGERALVYEVTLPSGELRPEDLLGRPQEVIVQPRREGFQPALFDSGLRYPLPEPAPMVIRDREGFGVIPPEFVGLKVQTRLVRAPDFDPDRLPQVTSPQDVQPIFRLMRNADREHLLAVYLDTKNHVIGVQEVVIGTKNMALVASDAIYRTAILLNASGLIIAHNHPSGDPSPSAADRDIYLDLLNRCKLNGIDLLDAFVVGASGDYSFKAGRVLPAPAPAHPPPSRRTIVSPAQPALLDGRSATRLEQEVESLIMEVLENAQGQEAAPQMVE